MRHGPRRCRLPTFPKARTTHIQSVDDFHSFFPMEVIATPEETAAFMEVPAQAWRLVTEHRDFPVRMRHFIPWHWTTRADTDVLRSRVLKTRRSLSRSW